MKRYEVVFGFMKGGGRGVRVRGIFRCYEDADVSDLARRILGEHSCWGLTTKTVAELEEIAGE